MDRRDHVRDPPGGCDRGEPLNGSAVRNGVEHARASTLTTLLGLAAALLLAAAAWQLLPRRLAPGTDVRAVLLDVSASVTRSTPTVGRSMRAILLREALAAQESGEDVLVVAAGAGARRVFGPGAGRALRELLEGRDGRPLDPLGPQGPGGDDESRLAQGARLVQELLAGRGGSLLFVGDGTYTGDDPAPVVEQLGGRGVVWRGVERLRRERSDAALVDFRAPRRAAPGAPVTVAVDVLVRTGASAPSALVLELAIEEAGRIRVVERALAPPFPTTAAVDLGALEAGVARVRARVRIPGAVDAVPENDELERVIQVGDAALVGVLRPPSIADALDAALGTVPGITFVVQEELELTELDAVLAVDVPVDDLPAPLLRSFVRQGGGLLVAGGLRALAGWSAGPGDEELARILPMHPDAGSDDVRRVTVLVDGSGSMEGRPFALVREAVLELVRAAPPGDEVELRFFTAVLRPPTFLGGAREEREAVAQRLLEARVPGGSTRIVESLEELARERARPSAQERALVLLLTDGREASDVVRIAERASALAASFAAVRTELVAFAVGERADLSVLAVLAGSEGAVRRAEDLADLTEMFRFEVNRERIREGPLEAVPVPSSSSDLAAQAVGLGAQPVSVRRMLRCSTRPDAEVAWAAVTGEPLLAVAREGRGRTAALASLPLGGWAPDWAGELAPLVRWLARRPDDEPMLVVVRGGEIAVRGFADAPPRILASVRRDPDPGSVEVELFRDPVTGLLTGALPAELARGGRGVLSFPGRSLHLPFSALPAAEFREPPLELAVAPSVGEPGRPAGSLGPAGGPANAGAGAGLLALGMAAGLAAGLLGRVGGRRTNRQAPLETGR